MPDSNLALTTPQLAELATMPMRKVLLYVEQGCLTPSILAANGHGSKRLWSVQDLAQALLVWHLRALGLTPKRLKQIVARFPELDIPDVPAVRLIIEVDAYLREAERLADIVQRRAAWRVANA